MKNFLLLCLILAALYLYWHPRTEVQTVAEPTPAPVQQVQATPPPKLYYHSPLEAGALPTGVSATAGYYSTNPTEHFNTYTAASGGSRASTIAPAAVSSRSNNGKVSTNGTVAAPVRYRGYGTTIEANATQSTTGNP